MKPIFAAAWAGLALAGLALVGLGPVAAAGAQDEAAPAPPAETFPAPVAPEGLRPLDADELLARMNGAELRGCYIDGRERNGLDPQWGERTATDGGLYDLMAGDVRVGRWYTVNAFICYVYERTVRETYCFSVDEADGELYFTPVDPGVPPGQTAPIATTNCAPPAVS